MNINNTNINTYFLKKLFDNRVLRAALVPTGSGGIRVEWGAIEWGRRATIEKLYFARIERDILKMDDRGKRRREAPCGDVICGRLGPCLT